MKQKLLITLVAIALGPTPLWAGPTTVGNTDKGSVVTAGNGRTLYTFRKDRPGVSACARDCLQNWPPFLAKTGAKAGDASTIVTRADGRLQWADARGMPYYFFAGDSKAGEANGDGIGGVWDAARP